MKNIFTFCLFITMAFSCKNGVINNSKYDILFDKHFEIFPEASVTRGQAINTEVEREAFMFYGTGHYDKSAASFAQLYDQYRHPRHKFYAAVSNLGEGNVDVALAQMESLSEEGKLSNKYMLDYYKGLAYLKKGEIDKAKSALAAVGSNFKYYQDKASDLMRELNN